MTATCLKRCILTAFVCILPLFSCTTRSAKRIKLLDKTISSQEFEKAIKDIKGSPELYGKLNRFLYFLDLGLLYHYSNKYEESITHLQKAEAILDGLYARSITNEAASLLTNDNLRPYRAKRYEQILLHQFLAFNYLALNEFDEALVETRKVQLVFDRFKSKDKGRDKYNDDGMSHFLSSIVYDAQGEIDDAVISLYQSVSAYQNGPVQCPGDVKDLAYYRFLKEERNDDIDKLNLKSSRAKKDVPGLDNQQSEIILVGYAGRCPTLGETVFWGTYIVDGLMIIHYRNPAGDTVTLTMPAPPIPEKERKKEEGEKTRSGQTFHIKFAFPEIVDKPSQADHFVVSAGATPVQIQSTELTDAYLLLQKDMEDNHLKTLIRTALRVVIRTVASQKAKKEMQTESGLANLLLNVGTDLLAGQLEKADTRLCFFFPGTVHIARIPVDPGTHSVEASAVNRSGGVIDKKVWDNVAVGNGKKKFLFYTMLK
jgi:hypothetical protein